MKRIEGLRSGLACILACAGLLLGPARVVAQDPTISIKSVAGTANSSIYGTFTVTNNGNKTLLDITLYAFRTDTGVYYQAKMDIVGGKIPDVEVPVAGRTNYTCLAVLRFTDGTPIMTWSPAKANIFVNSGTADKTDYGKLTNDTVVIGNTVEVTTTYTQDQNKNWSPTKDKVVTIWLLPVLGGRFTPLDSTDQGGGSWFSTQNVAKGSYILIGFLPISSATDSKIIATKITPVSVTG